MRCRKIKIDGRIIILRKSRFKIDSSNAHGYTILQLLSVINLITDMNEGVRKSIIKYMRKNKVNNSDLISLSKFFPAQTIKNLIYSGVLNGLTQL